MFIAGVTPISRSFGAPCFVVYSYKHAVPNGTGAPRQRQRGRCLLTDLFCNRGLVLQTSRLVLLYWRRLNSYALLGLYKLSEVHTGWRLKAPRRMSTRIE